MSSAKLLEMWAELRVEMDEGHGINCHRNYGRLRSWEKNRAVGIYLNTFYQMINYLYFLDWYQTCYISYQQPWTAASHGPLSLVKITHITEDRLDQLYLTHVRYVSQQVGLTFSGVCMWVKTHLDLTFLSLTFANVERLVEGLKFWFDEQIWYQIWIYQTSSRSLDIADL